MRRCVLVLLLLVAVGLASCSRTRRVMAPTDGRVFLEQSVADIEWMQGQYFLLYDPSAGAVFDVEEPSIRLYLDDGNFADDVNTVAGKAVLDPDGALGQPLSTAQDTSAVRGAFDLLSPGPAADYEVLNDVYAFHDTLYRVIRLAHPISRFSNQVLAATFTAAPIVGAGHALGAPVQVGGRTLTAPGPDSGSVLLKLLRVPRSRQTPTADMRHYDTTAPLYPAHALELRNFYQLIGYQIDPASLQLTVQSGRSDPPVTGQNGVSFLEMLGLDSWDETPSPAVRGHDGRLDGLGYNAQTRAWMDFERGVLMLPDLRPFAPRVDPASAPAFERYLAAQVNRRRQLDPPTDDVYELYTPFPTDARWYIRAKFSVLPVRAPAGAHGR